MIPISLIICIEFVKVAQAAWINNDKDMYCEENNRKAHVFSSSLNEELGQIEYIFSDKTGTLTCNKMELKFLLIGNEIYGDMSCMGNENMTERKSRNDIKWIKKNSVFDIEVPDDSKAKVLKGINKQHTFGSKRIVENESNQGQPIARHSEFRKIMRKSTINPVEKSDKSLHKPRGSEPYKILEEVSYSFVDIRLTGIIKNQHNLIRSININFENHNYLNVSNRSIMNSKKSNNPDPSPTSQ